MGINIGDLSSIALCSVPPKPSNYLQRVGRSGRVNGNSFVLTVKCRLRPKPATSRRSAGTALKILSITCPNRPKLRTGRHLQPETLSDPVMDLIFQPV